MLGKKFWLKKIFYIRHLCFKSVLSHNVKKKLDSIVLQDGRKSLLPKPVLDLEANRFYLYFLSMQPPHK